MIKRWTDVAVSAVALLLFAPLMAGLAVAVHLSMGSPVLFRQTRVGRGEDQFVALKFRTMREAVDDDGAPLPDAERLTSVGRLLRRSSLDELPQLVNVLFGEMSLVGPRPLLPEYLSRYSTEQSRRHEMRPGMAGPVAAAGRNGLSWEQKLALDVRYVDSWSLWLDARLFVGSIRNVVLMRGISAEGHATMPPYLGAVPGDDRP